MNVFLDPLGQGAAGAARNSPGLEPKRKSLPRACQIPQPARLHNYFFNPIMDNEFLRIEEEIVKVLRTVFDPEIPVNIYDLGLVYRVEVDDDKDVTIDMTFTAPSCPAADFILDDVQQKVEGIAGVHGVTINLVFEPEWNKDMMTDEAKLELGLF